MDDLRITLRVGGKLTIELPDGRMATCTVGQILAASGYGPDWVTTSPNSGEVTLTLQEEPRTGEWAQDATGTPATLSAGEVIEVRDPLG